MVKALLFDMWGTVIENGVFPSPVRRIKRMLRINTTFPEYITRFEEVFMLPDYENLTQAFEAVCKEFKLSPPQIVIDKCVGLWNKNSILAKPFEEAFPALEKLKEKYVLFLVSNTDQFSADQVIKKFELEKYFEEIILSHDFGMLKTSKDFFKKIMKDYSLEKDDIVMVGDSLESDMKPAETAKIKSILVDRRNKRDYSPKVVSLSEIEKLL